jgi:hypothetical protein
LALYSHIVMFTLADAEDAPIVADTLRAMEGRIPQIRYVEVGIDDHPDANSAHVVLITRFDSREALEAYKLHPHHIQVLGGLADAGVRSMLKVDFAD